MTWWPLLIVLGLLAVPGRMFWRLVEKQNDELAWPLSPSLELLEAAREVLRRADAEWAALKAKSARDFDELLFARSDRYSECAMEVGRFIWDRRRIVVVYGDRAEVVLDDGTVATFEWVKARGA